MAESVLSLKSMYSKIHPTQSSVLAPQPSYDILSKLGHLQEDPNFQSLLRPEADAGGIQGFLANYIGFHREPTIKDKNTISEI